jgi:hypothetical protein
MTDEDLEKNNPSLNFNGIFRLVEFNMLFYL